MLCRLNVFFKDSYSLSRSCSLDISFATVSITETELTETMNRIANMKNK